MKKILFFTTICIALLTISSCHKNNPTYYTFLSTVTFKTTSDGIFYFEVDDTTAIVPHNFTEYPFKGCPEKRGMASYYTDFSSSKTIPGYKHSYDATLSGLDTVYTKSPVKSTGTSEGDSYMYGDDKIGVFLSGFPQVVIEDGYLFIPFAINVSYTSYDNVSHTINLVTGVNPEDPYEVELRHKANGDSGAVEYQSNINFPLQSLPDTHGETVNLTLKWKSLRTGETQSEVFKYCSRTDWPQPNN